MYDEKLAQTEQEIHERDITIQDLSMLLRRIIAKPTQKNLDVAWGYLCRKGLQGSVLRSTAKTTQG